MLRYLQQRRILIDLAEHFCKEVKYELNGKEYFGVSFKNNSGGFEIRNPYFKTSSSPKDITTFDNAAKKANVFKGFTDFLSFMAINKNHSKLFLILSVSSLKKPFNYQGA